MEEWRDIQGYEGLYQVSSCGRVKSLNYNKTGQERILKQRTGKGGYKVANNSTGVLNAPYTGQIYGKLIVYVSTADRHNDWDNWIWQIFYDTSGGIYFRYKVNNAPWHSWRTLHSTYSLISDRKIDEIEVLTNRIETLEQTVNQLLDKVNSDL